MGSGIEATRPFGSFGPSQKNKEKKRTKSKFVLEIRADYEQFRSMTQEEIIFAVDSMLDYLQFGGDIEKGVELYQVYGLDNGLKFRLGKMPRDNRLERLLTEKLNDTLLKRPYWRIATQRRQLKRKRIKQPEPVVQVVETAPIIIAQDRTEALDDIALRIKQLATKRAKYSNMLVDGDDEEAIIDNCKLLDLMAPIESELKTLESSRSKLRTGDAVEAQALDRVVISLKNDSYTLGQLEAMPLEEVMLVKKKINDTLIKAQKQAVNQKASEKTRKRNAEKAEELKRYKIVIGKIELQKRNG